MQFSDDEDEGRSTPHDAVLFQRSTATPDNAGVQRMCMMGRQVKDFVESMEQRDVCGRGKKRGLTSLSYDGSDEQWLQEQLTTQQLKVTEQNKKLEEIETERKRLAISVVQSDRDLAFQRQEHTRVISQLSQYQKQLDKEKQKLESARNSFAAEKQKVTEERKKVADEKQRREKAEHEVSKLKAAAVSAASAPAPAAPAAPAAPVAPAASRPTSAIMEEIVSEALTFFRQKVDATRKAQVAEDARLQAAHARAVAAAAPAAAPAAAAPAAAPAVQLWIRQYNPRYGTTREIRYNGARTKKFVYNSGTPQNEVWTEIDDAAYISALETLGTMTPARARFTPILGKTAKVDRGGHSYELEVVQSMTPSAAAAAAAPAAAPAPAAAAASVPVPPPPRPAYGPNSLGFDVLLRGTHMSFTTAQVAGWRTALNLNETHTKNSSSSLASLAAEWSAVSQGFMYSRSLSKVFCNAPRLATFLDMYEARGRPELRIVAHGVKDQNFDSFLNCASGFDLGRNGGTRHGHGLYVSLLDAIAADYTQFWPNPTSPDGTFLLLLCMEFPAMEYYYKDYHLNCNSNRRNYHARHGENDARVVRDPTLVLPLGLAHAM